MYVHYFRSKDPNFGDDLNGWIWNRLFEGNFGCDDGVLLIGIGTILAEHVPRLVPHAHTFMTLGSGVGYDRPIADVKSDSWPVAVVRGPLSANVLGLPLDYVGTDGAILLAALPEFQPLPDSQRQGVVFMPHHKATDFPLWRGVCERAGIEYLDPRWDSYALAQRIRRAKLVLADAMHAAIVADTLRVPWVPLVSSPQISTFKWLDWTQSLGLPYEPSLLPPISATTAALNKRLHWFGERHQLADVNIDLALASVKRPYHSPGGRLGYVNRKVRRTMAEIAAKWDARSQIDSFPMDSLPDALRSAQTAVAFLSDADTHRTKLAQMKAELSRARDIEARHTARSQ